MMRDAVIGNHYAQGPDAAPLTSLRVFPLTSARTGSNLLVVQLVSSLDERLNYPFTLTGDPCKMGLRHITEAVGRTLPGLYLLYSNKEN